MAIKLKTLKDLATKKFIGAIDKDHGYHEGYV
jgi:hypothetical protein